MGTMLKYLLLKKYILVKHPEMKNIIFNESRPFQDVNPRAYDVIS